MKMAAGENGRKPYAIGQKWANAIGMKIADFGENVWKRYLDMESYANGGRQKMGG
jgi:hypothetical protein